MTEPQLAPLVAKWTPFVFLAIVTSKITWAAVLGGSGKVLAEAALLWLKRAAVLLGLLLAGVIALRWCNGPGLKPKAS